MKKGSHWFPLPNPPVGPPEESLPISCWGFPVVFDRTAESVARAVGIWPAKRIAVGPLFFMLRADEKQAVLLHEVRHCTRLHMEKRVLWFPLSIIVMGLWWLVDRVSHGCAWTLKAITHHQELEADAFTVAQGYGEAMMRFLSRFGESVTTNDPFYPTREERLAALRVLIKEKDNGPKLAA
jgi:Zn-dependent protease with chaperone function